MNTSVWRQLNLNPCGKIVGDCAVRAIATALDVDWYQAYAMLCAEGCRVCDLPNSDAVWGNVLRQHGFKRYVIPNSYPDCYSANNFAHDHPDDGVYVLGFGGHVAVIKSGWLIDSWNSENEIPIFYWERN